MDDTEGPDDYAENVIRAIEAWTAETPSFLSHLSSMITAPIGWALSRIVPAGAIMGALTGFDWIAKNTRTAAASSDAEDLRACDQGADQVQTFHIALGAAGGGVAGAIGLPGIIADVPATITIAMRLIRQVGVEYGYTDDNEYERKFCFSILQSAGANTVQQKVHAHVALRQIAVLLARKTFKEMAAQSAGQVIGFRSQSLRQGTWLNKSASI